MSRASMAVAARMHVHAANDLHAEEMGGCFPVVPMPVLPNERLWALYARWHDLSAAERVEWDALTVEAGRLQCSLWP